MTWSLPSARFERSELPSSSALAERMSDLARRTGVLCEQTWVYTQRSLSCLHQSLACLRLSLRAGWDYQQIHGYACSAARAGESQKRIDSIDLAMQLERNPEEKTGSRGDWMCG